MAKNWSRSKSLFEIAELLPGFFSENKIWMIFLLEQGVNVKYLFRIVKNESTVEVGKTKKCLKSHE